MEIRYTLGDRIKGDFGARIENGCLQLPAELAALIEKADVQDAKSFLAFAIGNPDAVAKHMRWSKEEVAIATLNLHSFLDEHLDLYPVCGMVKNPKNNPQV